MRGSMSMRDYGPLLQKLRKNPNSAALNDLLNAVVLEAVSVKASDLHLEVFEKNLQIRYRVDGLLQDVLDLPGDLAASFASRLKLTAGLDIAERRFPQDGRCPFKFENSALIETRISTCPTMFGEKIALRFLYSDVHRELTDLGLSGAQFAALQASLQASQGLILVTGPTGSGKTATLYSALMALDRIERNVCSVEDPVEMILPRVNQVQVNPKIGFGFAEALRAFLRQDPDVIMLGEIRDAKTAEIALHASQTGHLVLSTVHSNSAAETLIRLKQLNVSRSELATCLKLILAQRLCRKLCEMCKEEQADGYQPGSCPSCYRGYSGRFGIFEALSVTPEVRQAMLQGKESWEIQAQFLNQDNLMNFGLERVRRGDTTSTELARILS